MSLQLTAFLSIVALVVTAVVLTEREVATAASINLKVVLFSLGMLGTLIVSSLVWTWFACHRILLLTGTAQESLVLIRPSSTSNVFVRTLGALNFEATVHRLLWIRETGRIDYEDAHARIRIFPSRSLPSILTQDEAGNPISM